MRLARITRSGAALFMRGQMRHCEQSPFGSAPAQRRPSKLHDQPGANGAIIRRYPFTGITKTHHPKLVKLAVQLRRTDANHRAASPSAIIPARLELLRSYLVARMALRALLGFLSDCFRRHTTCKPAFGALERQASVWHKSCARFEANLKDAMRLQLTI